MMKCHRLSIVDILFYLLLFQSTAYGQGTKASFVGKLTYKITICDTALERFIPVRYMTVYTNDTLIRIENETDRLGKQIVIKHLFLNKHISTHDNQLFIYSWQMQFIFEKAFKNLIALN